MLPFQKYLFQLPTATFNERLSLKKDVVNWKKNLYVAIWVKLTFLMLRTEIVYFFVWIAQYA